METSFSESGHNCELPFKQLVRIFYFYFLVIFQTYQNMLFKKRGVITNKFHKHHNFERNIYL